MPVKTAISLPTWIRFQMSGHRQKSGKPFVPWDGLEMVFDYENESDTVAAYESKNIPDRNGLSICMWALDFSGGHWRQYSLVMTPEAGYTNENRGIKNCC